MAPETQYDQAKLDELFEIIDGAKVGVPVNELIADVDRRIAQADRALVECKGVLVATGDPSFHPDGWRMPVGEAVRDTVAQKERLLAYKAELEGKAAVEPEPDLTLSEPGQD